MDGSIRSIIFLTLLFCAIHVSLALDEGSYGNESYGSFYYGISKIAVSSYYGRAEMVAGNNVIIEAPLVNVTLEILASNNASGTVTILRYSNVSLPFPASSLGRFMEIKTDDSIKNSLEYSIIKFRYSDSDVLASNLVEATLRLYRWDGASWRAFDGAGSGVNASGNYVYANTSHFSIWGVFGNKVQSSAAPQSGDIENAALLGDGVGGNQEAQTQIGTFVCNKDWECSDWSECENGAQLRECSLIKVPQHAKDTPCPDFYPPLKSRQCGANESAQAESISQTILEENKSSEPSEKTEKPKKTGFLSITGAFIAGLKSRLAKPSTSEMSFALVFVLLLAIFIVYLNITKRKN